MRSPLRGSPDSCRGSRAPRRPRPSAAPTCRRSAGGGRPSNESNIHVCRSGARIAIKKLAPPRQVPHSTKAPWMPCARIASTWRTRSCRRSTGSIVRSPSPAASRSATQLSTRSGAEGSATRSTARLYDVTPPVSLSGLRSLADEPDRVLPGRCPRAQTAGDHGTPPRGCGRGRDRGGQPS
jgi:hypothetical protein